MRASDTLRLLLLAAIWGASFLCMRVVAPEFGAINTAFLRVLFACTGLGAILLLLRHQLAFNGKFRVSLLLGVINSGIPFLMYCLAARWLPAGYSAILNATAPLMGSLAGCLFFQETLSVKRWLGVFIGLIGIMVITATGEAALSGGIIAGVLACLVATGCYGVAGFLTRRWLTERGGLNARLSALGSQIGATLFLLPFFAWSVSSGPAVHWAQPHLWFFVAALGLICTASAYILYFRLIGDIGPLRTLTVTFLIPPFGVLWGYAVLGETISQGFIAGALVVTAAVWLIVSPEKTAKLTEVK
ncbi:DMT family transporter [Candidatus Pantoea multigeneris]|uniref:EamA family transporter n=1 Tax=Candidatus Pantoea multigeneris TaxID=2608357 RepID=A0ABX0RH54_9GAMM|nr:EamA family transporter [Pantoea multigeneris]NIF23478.1 EamA family transporter [Pantoea multigeneris]